MSTMEVKKEIQAPENASGFLILSERIFIWEITQTLFNIVNTFSGEDLTPTENSIQIKEIKNDGLEMVPEQKLDDYVINSESKL